ncbi:hypothetical protein IQ255_29615 [Pleurocapsales cyanobacterium LEGE 10410]|nr:hypothetical protein [Pleurocapsales cyanobacterium LEGE 10410]
MNRNTIIIFFFLLVLVGCSYVWEVPFTNKYDQSVKVVWQQAVGYGSEVVESALLKSGETKEIKTSIWRTHTRSNFQFQMFHVINADNDTLETVFLNSGLIAWLGYNVELPLKKVPDQPDDRYKSFLKYCNGDPLSTNIVELFIDFINKDYDNVLIRSDQLLSEYTSPSEEAIEEFEKLAEDIDSANLQAVILLQILASEKQGSENIAENVNRLKRVFPEVFEHYSDQSPFNKIFKTVSNASA